MSDDQVLVVGVGNPDRGDDGAGIDVARRLRGHKRVVEITDCSALLDVWAVEVDVTVIDATVSEAEAGTITRFDGLAHSLPADTFASSHSFGLAESVELARVLHRLPERLTIYGIEGKWFDHGTPMSEPVRDAVRTLVARLLEGSR